MHKTFHTGSAEDRNEKDNVAREGKLITVGKSLWDKSLLTGRYYVCLLELGKRCGEVEVVGNGKS